MSRNKEKVSGIFRRLFRSATREGEVQAKLGPTVGQDLQLDTGM
nr:unnamed protein product [Callosobruchus analis]